MFWGLSVASGKSYMQTVVKDYHVTHAVLDTNTVTSKEIVSLNVDVNGSSFLLCNLSLHHNVLQVPLKCIFGKGEKITFSIKSNSESEKAVVYLSGHIIDTSSTKEVASNGVSPLSNVTNLKVKTLKSSINKDLKNEPSTKDDKENEAPAENKTDSKSRDKKTSQKNKNKTSKSEKQKKEISITDMLNSYEEEDEDDDEYSPEEEENVNEEMEDEEDDDDDEDEVEEEEINLDEEEEINLEEEEEDNDSSDDDSSEIEEEKDVKENKDEDDEVLTDLPKKRKRRRSTSSAGRTPLPKASKKPKIQELSGSPVLTETSTKKKKSKTSAGLDSPSVNESVSMNKTPKKSEKEKKVISLDEKSDASPSSESKGKKRMGMGGVVLEDLVIGTGATAAKGKKASVYYEGKLLKSGQVFDSVKVGRCFKFKLGASEVIKAWDIGVVGMKVGGKRRIVAPPAMAYGKAGCPPKIPPNSILTFDVELKGVN